MRPLLFTFLILLNVLTASSVFAAGESDPGFVVHILSYIRKDYGGAVGNGKIISPPEYQEQQDFIRSALQSARDNAKLGGDKSLIADIEALQQDIAKLASPAVVAEKALSLENRVIQIAGLEVAPLHWPDRAHGKQLYQQNCTRCHGMNGHGDGPSGKGLEPPPADFYAQSMSDTTPFQLYNTIKLGVPGTGMAAFAFPERELWDLTFYVVSLRYETQSIGNEALPSLALADVANSTDNNLLAKLPGDPASRAQKLARIRLHSVPSQGATHSLAVARAQLDEVLAALRRGDAKAAKQAAVMAYLDGVEPIEPRLRAKDNDLTLLIEEKMANLRAAIDAGLPVLAVEKREAEVRQALVEVENTLAKPDFTPVVSFWVAMGIFTREAFEAILIIITLLGVVRSLGARKAALYVHAGWASALALGLVGWIFSGWVLKISGAQRELLEGVVAFLAVAVLLYFGFWLHRRTEIGRWRTFLNEMAKAAVDGKNLFALAAVSFMAVFREAFETILFLRALVLETGPAHHFAVGAGVSVAFIVVVILAMVLVKYSVRLPLRQLFAISSAILLVLSFILLGKGVHSFQEVGLLAMTPFPLGARLDVLGIFPTYESWIPQLILIVGSLTVWGIGRIRSAPPLGDVSKSSR